MVEGEGGLTPGASHETRNSAWGLGLSNLVFLLDWNDYGIDDPAISSVVPGTPQSWFEAYHWRVNGTMEGSEWGPVTAAVLEAARGENPMACPRRRGSDAQGPRLREVRQQEPRHAVADERARVLGRPPRVHGAPAWPTPAWTRRRRPMPAQRAGAAQPRGRHLRPPRHTDVVDAVSDRLLEVAGSSRANRKLPPGRPRREIFDDPRFTDVTAYPASHGRPRREGRQPGRAGVVGGVGQRHGARADYDRPLFIVCSADLAESTNIAGFAKDWEDLPGWGWYNRETNLRGRCCRSRSPSSRTAA